MNQAMAERPTRKKQPFRFWYPSWGGSSPSRTSQQPRRQQTRPHPLTIPSKPQTNQASLQNSSETIKPHLSEDQMAAQTIQTASPLPSPMPSQRLTKTPSPSISGRRESLGSPSMHSDSSSTRGAEMVEATVINKDPKPAQFSSIDDVGIRENLKSQTLGSEPRAEDEPESKDRESKPTAIEPHIFATATASSSKAQQEEKIREELKPELVEGQHEEFHSEVPNFQPNKECTKEDLANNAFSKPNIRCSPTTKERRICISTMPQTSSSDAVPPCMQQDLQDGLSRLVQKLRIGHQSKLGNEEAVNIITIASENRGASMYVGYDALKEKQKIGKTMEAGNEIPSSISASINSNVQGINSSILDETNYSERNPGVHLTVSTKPTLLGSNTGETKRPAAQKLASSGATYESNTRRRCLRGLFLESSDDETKNPQKPRRHGCRFSCDDDDKKKGENTSTLRKT